jgi:hypothetical protein
MEEQFRPLVKGNDPLHSIQNDKNKNRWIEPGQFLTQGYQKTKKEQGSIQIRVLDKDKLLDGLVALQLLLWRSFPFTLTVCSNKKCFALCIFPV